MADLTPFTYRQGDSILHRIDVRCKFFVICMVSVSIFYASLPGVFLYLLILVFMFNKTGLNFFSTLNSMTYFLILLCFVFTARALTVKGEILFSFYAMSITKEGIQEGFLVAFKFFLVMMTGLLFSSTTRPSSVKCAVQWFLKPVPFVPEKRVAMMISLSLKFMPMILKLARDISDAQKARCADLEKNPVRKIIRLALPLMKKTFRSADSLIFAMASRLYNDDRTDPEFSSSGTEPYFLAAALILSSGLAVF